MMTLARFAVTAVTLGMLAGCSLPMLLRSDRDRICAIGVVEKFETAAFRENPLANPIGGPLGGAGMGALMGLHGSVLAIFTVPIGAAIGAVGGAACGVGALAHPDADANFQAILADVDAHSLARALAADAAANIAGDACRTGAARPAAPGKPDATVALDALEVGMGCPYGRQQLSATVRWRVLDGADGRELAAATTRCWASSTLAFGEWFADTPRARAEIEILLTKTGQRIAEQMFAPRVSTGCTLE